MTIEPVTELGSGGALRLPRARVVPLSAPPSSYTAAVERYLTGAGIAKSSARIYRISLTTWGWMLAGEPPPTGPARRGAKPPVFRLLAKPLTSPDDIEDLDGWTLHLLRHSALTHDAEDGTSPPMLLARSRHASVRSLERYARPGVDCGLSRPNVRTGMSACEIPRASGRMHPRRPCPAR